MSVVETALFGRDDPPLRYIKDILIRKKSAKSAIIPLITFTITSKDVRLPVQLQRAMAAEAEAAREARAKVMMVMLVVKTLVIIVMILVLMLVIKGQGHNVGMRTWNMVISGSW